MATHDGHAPKKGNLPGQKVPSAEEDSMSPPLPLKSPRSVFVSTVIGVPFAPWIELEIPYFK
jgi:hypothetical protein